MKNILSRCLVVGSIMGTANIFVNADPVVLTKAIPEKSPTKTTAFEKLIDTLSNEGRMDRLAATVGPHLDVTDQAPIKYISLRPHQPQWTKRFCDLVFTTGESRESGIPHCLVMMTFHVKDKDVTVTHYRFDLHGNLVAAAILRGQNDDSGKPVGGSGQYTPQDVSDKETVKAAQQELKFWLSGEYKKFLKPAAATEVRPASPAK